MSFVKKPQMSSDEFKAALREAGFGVAQGWLVDVSGKCPGFATMPSFNKGVLNRNAAVKGDLGARRLNQTTGRSGGTRLADQPPAQNAIGVGIGTVRRIKAEMWRHVEAR
jgi:hypothetical protein